MLASLIEAIVPVAKPIMFEVALSYSLPQVPTPKILTPEKIYCIETYHGTGKMQQEFDDGKQNFKTKFHTS